ncbi:MAG: molybdopterin-guanine dinucleotide biosynthesis protein B [candidate division Zixibacteria bacterium]|nr:molybdopterin-guanine dinucleotide biosynthesis protein B [candidate division Zixibacteria bacterium]
MLELGIVGAKNSGKTTVVEKLVCNLEKNGVRTATVKHTSHSHRFDTPGKDSYRHREAGATLTVIVSEEEVAVFARPDTLEWTRIQELTDNQFDIWLVEGERRSDRAKVLVTRELADMERPLPNNIVATIGPERVDKVDKHFEPDDFRALGSFVIDTILNSGKEAQ